MSETDRRLMARALELAQRGLYTTHPNPRVGCVLAHGDAVVGEGWHMRAGEPHAEVYALREAGDRARGSTAYVTLEPCSHHGRTPPCAMALIEAGIARVVAAMEDPDPRVAGSGLGRLRAAGIAVENGLMRTQAEAINPGFIMRHRHHRPFIRAKLGVTLDGRMAMASGESRWITSPEARRDAQRLRARSDAIMTGIGTVLADDPSLTVRTQDLDLGDLAPFIDAAAIPQPARIVLDSRLRTPRQARLLALPGRVVIATAVDAGRAGTMASDKVEVIRIAGGDGEVDLAGLLGFLAERRVNEVLLEAGPTLNGAMLAAGLIDEVVVYMAPKVIGDDARGMFTLPGIERLEQAIELDLRDVRSVGGDLRLTLGVARQGE